MRKTLPVPELGRMIKQAERDGLSATAIMRLLKLYLGTDTHGLLNEWGVYMQCNFNQLASVLKMKSPTELIRYVRQSGWFIVGECPPANRKFYPIVWFASPIFLDEKELTLQLASDTVPQEPLAPLTDDVMLGGLFSSPNALPATPTLDSQNGPVNCIINYTGKQYIILSGRKQQAASGAPSGTETATPATKRKLPENVREQIVVQFIEEVRRSDIHKPMFDSILTMLTNPMKDGKPIPRAEKFSQSEAREILRILMYCHIKPYFMDSDRFFNTQSFTNRVAWLQSLLFSGYGKRLLNKAKVQYKRTCNRKQRQEQMVVMENRRSNRPHSPHEWLDNDRRYYEDSLDGVVEIPLDAPPRPSAACHWNFVSLIWYES